MKHLLPLLALSALAACGGGGGSAPGPLPVVPATTQAVPAPTVLVTLGDSITAGAHGSAYPPMLASTLGASLVNLGIGGEFSGATDYQIPGGVRLQYGGVLTDEVPNIPVTATIVTLYIGTNDLIFSGDPGVLTYTQAAAYYDANVRAIVAGIKAKVPKARIILASVPNSANRPNNGMLWAQPLRDQVTTMATAMRATLYATGLPVVDLMNEPAMYDDANFGGATDPHPVASGFAVIASDFAKAILH